jgi:hypothetical protein
MSTDFDVVVPTSGRPSLETLLVALDEGSGPLPGRLVVVDDRRRSTAPLDLAVPPALERHLVVVAGPGRGPAAARNAGLAAATATWVAFLDDDVIPEPGWRAALAADVADLGPEVAGSQGRVHVPRPAGRPTDWERNVAGLADAAYITADLVYRREVLERLGGFDERFRRPYREDSELACRILEAGFTIVRGRRIVTHPVRPAGFWTSVRLQAGNADDELMSALHGRDWRTLAGAPRGRRRRHLATVAAAAAGVAGLVLRRRWVAAAGLAAWTAGTAELAWRRIAPGPRDRGEVTRMLATSVVLPFAAGGAAGAGVLRWRLLQPAGARIRSMRAEVDRSSTNGTMRTAPPSRSTSAPSGSVSRV